MTTEPQPLKTARQRFPCPARLGPAGQHLWRTIIAAVDGVGFDPDERELVILEQAARQADVNAALQASIDELGVVVKGAQGQPRLNAAVTELRQGRLAVEKLLGALELPAGDEDEPKTARSLRAQRAAEVRWGRDRRKRAA